MTNTPIPQALPQSGGSYTRLADGSLVLTEEPTMDAAVASERATTAPSSAAVKAPVKSPVKEA